MIYTFKKSPSGGFDFSLICEDINNTRLCDCKGFSTLESEIQYLSGKDILLFYNSPNRNDIIALKILAEEFLKNAEEEINYDFLTTKYVPAIKKQLKKYYRLVVDDKSSSVTMDGSVIIIKGDTMYKISCFFTVEQITDFACSHNVRYKPINDLENLSGKEFLKKCEKYCSTNNYQFTMYPLITGNTNDKIFTLQASESDSVKLKKEDFVCL